MALKIALIALVVLALGAAIFAFHFAASGGVKFPSIFSSSTFAGFSILPSQREQTLPTIPQGTSTAVRGAYSSGAAGQGGAGWTAAANLTVDPSTVPASQIPSGWTAAQLSPYFHEVRIGGVSSGGFGYYGTITLNTYFANPQATGTIDITRWHIKTRASGEYIPGAIALYDPSGLAAPSDIRLKNGDVVYLYSSSAPFNLRLNECIGWIAGVANFQPAIPAYCPPPALSRATRFSGACQQYVETLGGCTPPDLSSPLVPRTDYACQDYLENNFNYKSCFDAHLGDPNFLSNQVWVWMGSNVVNQYHDTVDLLDANGKLVDEYTY